MPFGFPSAVWLGCDHENRCIIVGFDTRVSVRHEIATLQLPQLLHQLISSARCELSMEDFIGIDTEDIDESYEPVRGKHNGLTRQDMCLKAKLLASPGSDGAHHPVAIGAIKLGAVFQDLAPHSLGDSAWLVSLGSKGSQGLLLEWFCPLVRPADNAAVQWDKGDDVPQETALQKKLPIIRLRHAHETKARRRGVIILTDRNMRRRLFKGIPGVSFEIAEKLFRRPSCHGKRLKPITDNPGEPSRVASPRG
jgi:hypothetical protein